MLELGIIVTVALIVFLLLKNYPRVVASDGSKADEKRPTMKIIKKYFERKRDEKEQEIIESLNEGKSEIVSPKQVEDAKKSFGSTDPEVAKLLHEANDALEAEEYRKAEEKSLKALQKDKHSGQAYAFIAAVAIHKKQFSDAEEALKIALKCNKNNGLAHASFGELNFIQEKFNDAIDHFQKAVNLDRNNASWQAGLGKSYLMVRQFSKAAKALKRAATLNIDNSEYKKLAMEAEQKLRDQKTVMGSK